MMKCLDYKPNIGGEAEYAYCLALALKKLGHRITVLATSCSTSVSEDKSLPGRAIRKFDLEKFVPLNRVMGWVKWSIAMRTLKESVRRVYYAESPDICLETSYSAWWYFAPAAWLFRAIFFFRMVLNR